MNSATDTTFFVVPPPILNPQPLVLGKTPPTTIMNLRIPSFPLLLYIPQIVCRFIRPPPRLPLLFPALAPHPHPFPPHFQCLVNACQDQTNRPIDQSVDQCLCISINHSTKQSSNTSNTLREFVRQSIDQEICEPDQSTIHLTNLPTKPHTNQSSQSAIQRTNQLNQQINQPTDISTNQSMNPSDGDINLCILFLAERLLTLSSITLISIP